MKTLYLHIGTPKTATTAIQMFCVENRDELNRHGFEYPLPDIRFPHVNPRRNGHFLVARLYEDRYAERTDYSDKWWDTGINALHGAFDRFDNVILSDENMWTTSSRNTVWWERLLDDAKNTGYTVKVIVYLRRQDEYASSWLSQRIKVGYNGFTTTKWDEYIEKPSGTGYDYYSMLEKISPFTGRSNIIVRVYDRGRFKGCDGTIFSDFMDAIGLEYTDAYTISSSESNYSLTGNSQEIKRIMNIVAPEYNDFQKYLREKIERLEATKDINDSFVMFTGKEFKKFMKKYEEGNRKIAEEYLAGNNGEGLFSDTLNEGIRWTPDNEFMYEDIIRFFGSIICDQFDTIERLNAEISVLTRDNESVEKEIENLYSKTGASEKALTDEEFSAIAKSCLIRQKEIDSINYKIKNLEKEVTDRFYIENSYREISGNLRRLNNKVDNNIKNAQKLKESLENIKQAIKHPVKTIVNKTLKKSGKPDKKES